MKLIVCENTEILGERAAAHAADRLNAAIAQKGSARLLLSTGASQFCFFDSFVRQAVRWDKVEMFHLDEYVGIPDTHPASFRRYLTERFVRKVRPGIAHLIDGRQDPGRTIAELTALLAERPIDVGVVGIGENAHIAFNDPPADFADTRAYKVVRLAETCIAQQIGEGWFRSKEEAYTEAITMTCSKILESRCIVSVVPYTVKANAVRDTLENEPSPDVPATIFKTHPDVTMYCDRDSASLLTKATIERYAG